MTAKEYTKEITGERLNKFKTIVNHDNKYITEEELCQRYSLDRVQLYHFFKERGRLENGSHREKNFSPNKPNLDFGPLVRVNNGIVYLYMYWQKCFDDPIYKALLQECQKNSVKVAPLPRPSRGKVQEKHKYEYISSIYKILDGELCLMDSNDPTKLKRIILNEGKDTTYDHKTYNIVNLRRALIQKTDYRSRYPKNDCWVEPTPVVKTDSENLDTIFPTIINDIKPDTYSDESITLLKLQAFDLAIKAHATNSSRSVEQYYTWISSELRK